MNDVIIVGGGLAGLAAATYVARAGRSALVLERASELGGRGRTTRADEFALNFGPHALYAAGAGVGVLRDLGVAFTGATPSTAGLLGIAGGRMHALPGGLLSLLSTDLLDFGGKVDAARILASLTRIDTERLASTPLAEWLARVTKRREVRHVIAALVRVATYSNAPDVESAGAALAQVRRAIASNVRYLDGGWQTLVDGLASAARAAGARIACSAHVDALARDAYGRVGGVTLVDGTVVAGRAVILACPPSMLARWRGAREEAAPIRAACIDLALTSLPRPKRRFALGVDAPYYFSVHSAVARLAPAGAALVHVAKYLDPAEPVDAKRDEAELEAVLDLVQPGWRERVAHRRTLPAIAVAHARVTAASGARRRSPIVHDVPSLFVAGDWVDGEGMLADTALSSARDAAAHAVASLAHGAQPRMAAE